MTWLGLVIWRWLTRGAPKGAERRLRAGAVGGPDAAGTSGGWVELGAEAVGRRVEIPTLGCAHLLRSSHEGALVTEARVPPPALVSVNPRIS